MKYTGQNMSINVKPAKSSKIIINIVTVIIIIIIMLLKYNTIKRCYTDKTTLLTYLLTYLVTPWCRALPEQLTGLQLVKKFTAFHGTRRFITALTSVRHLSLYWASPIQSVYPHPTSWKSFLILPTHLRLGLHSGPFPSGFPTKTLFAILFL